MGMRGKEHVRPMVFFIEQYYSPESIHPSQAMKSLFFFTINA